MNRCVCPGFFSNDGTERCHQIERAYLECPRDAQHRPGRFLRHPSPVSQRKLTITDSPSRKLIALSGLESKALTPLITQVQKMRSVIGWIAHRAGQTNKGLL